MFIRQRMTATSLVLGAAIFQDEDAYRMTTDAGSVNYAKLAPGNLVRTVVFNGILLPASHAATATILGRRKRRSTPSRYTARSCWSIRRSSGSATVTGSAARRRQIPSQKLNLRIFS